MAFWISTQVVSKAVNHNLITLGTWKDDWGVKEGEDNSFLSRTISRCSQIAENFCNRVFVIETVQDTITLQRDQYSNAILGNLDVIQLTRFPLVQITSLTENGVVLVEGTDFCSDKDTGQLFRLSPITNWRRPWWDQPIVVNYSGGYNLPEHSPDPMAEDLPEDIQDAVSRLVWLKFVSRGLNPFVTKEIVAGIGGTDYAQSALIDNMPKDVYETLANYRFIPVGY